MGANSGISNIVQHQVQHLDEGQLTWRANFYYPVGYTFTFLPRENNIANQPMEDMDSLLHLQCFDNTVGISFDISAFGCETKYHIRTGLDKIDPSLITIYPNPSRGSFQVETPENLEIISSEIITLDGKQYAIESTEGKNVNIRLNPGIYVINVHFSNGTFASKRVVVH
ncbi:MAG: T9SS type A sorting domain-containing protein [Bacteroidia bacterium]